VCNIAGPVLRAGSVEAQMVRWDTNIGSTDEEKFGHLFRFVAIHWLISQSLNA